LAALLLTPRRVWWLLLLAAFPAHWLVQLQSDVPPLMIFCWFISNSCEALIGAALIRYFISRPVRFDRLRNVAIFSLCGAALAPFFSSFLDAGFVRWNHWGQGLYWELFRIRFTSNVLAALTVTPVILAWATSGIAALRKTQLSFRLEAIGLFLALFSVSFIVLFTFGSGADPALLFLPLPLLMWAAVRFGSVGANTAVSIVTFLAIWSAAHGHGPFSGQSTEGNALSIQIFLIVLSVPMLFLGAVIEERAKGERSLRESEQRFRIVADAAPVLIWMSGLDRQCVFFNKTWVEFTGRRNEQEIGNGWAEGVHPNDLERCLEVYTAAFDSRKPFVMQYRLRRHDGEYRWISDNGVPRYDSPGVDGYVGDPKGVFAGYIGSCTDITDLISKEQALRESEARIGLAAESANLAFWIYDAEKDTVWLSEKGREIYGFTPEEPLCRASFRPRIHSDEREIVAATFECARASSETFEIEHRIIKPGSETRWVVVRGRYLRDEQGKIFEIVGVTIDVTGQKRAALQLQLHRQELSHLSRVAVMGEMAASLAHELNQPLSGIVSNAGAGLRFLERGDVDLKELHDLLGDISADGHRAGDVIRGIRDMVKKESTVRKLVNLNDVVTSVAHIVKPEALLHSCQLKLSREPDLPSVEADPIALQQVLVNLVLNALDAMRDVPVNRRIVEISTMADGERGIQIHVRDHGPGISSEIRDRVFDQFFTTKTNGLGMGLAIARSIIESFGGTIAVENVESGGAQFRFALPTSVGALA
jgi:PAS domain S-box-containing protein